MPLVRCPHCGPRTFSIESWADLDHCPRCGRPLASRDPRAIEDQVRERLYGRRRTPGIRATRSTGTDR
jgi:rRNA maturation protein Nop10